MDYQKLLKQQQVRPYLLEARLGLEKESQRVTLAGDLVTSEHPQVLGNRSFHPYIQTDFAETQMELITPVTESPKELLRWLAAIHDVAYRSMDRAEMLWPLSMPPALPAKEEEIILAKLDAHEDVLYRRYLAREYGRRKQMVSGIHFNFEFGTNLVRHLFEQQTELTDFEQFKTGLYLKVTRNYLRYRWLITYLFGASPLSNANYFVEHDAPNEPVRSIRNSKFGYRNHDNVVVSYDSLDAYIHDIAKMVETGKLSEEKEFYAPVRFRGGKKVADLKDTGIHYIELRNLDLNPLDRYGFDQNQAEFMQLFLLFMLWTEEEAGDDWVQTGDRINDEVALEHPLKESRYQVEGRQLLADMEAMAEQLGLPIAANFFELAETMLADPSQTLAGQIYQAAQNGPQSQWATKIARENHEAAWARPYQLAGFTGMELSTQIFLFDAIQKGVSAEILDEHDQFLKLSFNGRVEYVKNANMTSKDSYVVPLMMANKTVTKKVLAKAGFRVPGGAEFADLASAQRAYPKFAQQGIVVKPKSTNYGLGISIFQNGASQEDYEAALAIAFAEDSEVLVEEFVSGTEYRFFVLDGQIKAIMLRVPANVVGDGERSVSELVAEKNLDPLRGSHHRSPLELIQLGEIEKLMLKEQGLTVNSIPTAGQIVYLRENSNISTGGDSIDVTDTFDEDYKKIAAAAVAALGAKISGIDLIIPDKTKSAFGKDAYAIIEANFNPAMHMHVYPYSGQSRRLTMDVLKYLYPEIH